MRCTIGVSSRVTLRTLVFLFAIPCLCVAGVMLLLFSDNPRAHSFSLTLTCLSAAIVGITARGLREGATARAIVARFPGPVELILPTPGNAGQGREVRLWLARRNRSRRRGLSLSNSFPAIILARWWHCRGGVKGELFSAGARLLLGGLTPHSRLRWVRATSRALVNLSPGPQRH
jgi:hypothetical protein